MSSFFDAISVWVLNYLAPMAWWHRGLLGAAAFALGGFIIGAGVPPIWIAVAENRVAAPVPPPVSQPQQPSGSTGFLVEGSTGTVIRNSKSIGMDNGFIGRNNKNTDVELEVQGKMPPKK